MVSLCPLYKGLCSMASALCLSVGWLTLLAAAIIVIWMLDACPPSLGGLYLEDECLHYECNDHL